MSVVVVELAGSKKISQSAEGKRSGTRSFFVYDDEGTSLIVDDILFASGVPLLGSTHPDMVGLYANNWNLTVSDDRANAWSLVWNYSTTFVDTQPDEEAEDTALPDGLQGFSMTVGVTIIDIWKADPTMPANRNTPATADIGGTTVSEGGLPISMALPTADIRLREKFTGLFEGGKFLSKVGKRNSSYWQGFSAGSVLFTGMNVNHTRDGVNEIEYTLAWDKWYHLRQVPERDDDGNPVVDGTADPTINVYFKQPFEDTTNFSFLPM
tara:strand:+ start:10121 stop:10921 length:801 start_codon:yes stop_codon:yes gene_type:complete